MAALRSTGRPAEIAAGARQERRLSRSKGSCRLREEFARQKLGQPIAVVRTLFQQEFDRRQPERSWRSSGECATEHRLRCRAPGEP
jgi:hypothetical protein